MIMIDFDQKVEATWTVLQRYIIYHGMVNNYAMQKISLRADYL